VKVSVETTKRGDPIEGEKKDHSRLNNKSLAVLACDCFAAFLSARHSLHYRIDESIFLSEGQENPRKEQEIIRGDASFSSSHQLLSFQYCWEEILCSFISS
jgi:hypothetical protein